MKVRLRRTTRRVRIQWWPVLGVLAWFVVVVGIGYWTRATGNDYTVCHFHRITGVPCPTCGGTRGALRVFDGDILGAWLMNPFLFTAAGIALVLFVLKVGFARELDLGLSRGGRRVAWGIVTALFLASWVWVIVYT